jgi:hypothetical protein
MSTLDREAERHKRAAEDLFRHGRDAVKAGERVRGKQLLQQAVDHDRGHAEAWLWLSATTDDPAEQQRYLEWAIAADPSQAAAKRGLALLTGRIRAEDVVPEGQSVTARQPQTPEAAAVRRAFTCPRCGGRMRFEPEIVDLRCENCGYVEAVTEEPAAGAQQVLDYALPTRQGQRWAEAERRYTCRQCGAASVLPPGRTSDVCPFCGTAALLAAPEAESELLPPQAVIPMHLEAEAVLAALRTWLGRGFFAPDDLAQLARGSGLSPVYVPFWSFNTSLTSRWRAEVQEEVNGRSQTVARTGEETTFYTHWLQPGTRALPAKLLRELEPFDFDQAVLYKPEYLAGWPAGAYDVSLAQGSLDARAAMIEAMTARLWKRALPGRLVTNLQVTGSDFTGQTYQLALLPVWVGNYHYRGRAFRVLVNGQTGKVVGDKPVDTVKLWLLAALVLAVGLVLGFVGWALLTAR